MCSGFKSQNHKKLEEKVKNEIRETSHWLIFDKKNLTYKQKIKIIDNYTKCSFDERKKYVQKHAELSFEERMSLVEKQLSLYKNARLVITDRIHVALPCLAMEVPVLLIYYEKHADRIESFKNFVTNCTEEEFYNYTGEQLLKIKNSKKYLSYKKKMIDKVNKFIDENVEYDNNVLPSTDSYQEIIKKVNYDKKMYEEILFEQKNKIKMLEKKQQQMKMKEQTILENIKKKQREILKQQMEIDEYRKIKNSKTWKIIGKYYNIKLKKDNN